MATDRFGWLGVAGLTLLLGAAALGCSSGGTTSNVGAAFTAATIAPEVGLTPDAGPPVSCGDVDADLVSRALGVDATYLGEDPSGCGFTAGSWYLGVRVEPSGSMATGEVQNSPSLGEASVPNQTFVTNDRSGYWFANSVFVVNDQVVTFRLVNMARGSDAYPPVEGEPQEPVTRAAAIRLIDEIAAAS